MVNLLDVVRVFIPLAFGLAFGYLLRGRHLNLSKVICAVILVLVFSLGFTVGLNDELLAAMPNVGLKALVLSAVTLIFSILFVKAASRLVRP